VKNHENHAQFTRPPPVNDIVGEFKNQAHFEPDFAVFRGFLDTLSVPACFERYSPLTENKWEAALFLSHRPPAKTRDDYSVAEKVPPTYFELSWHDAGGIDGTDVQTQAIIFVLLLAKSCSR
jgi:hypothetical protein